MCSSTADQAARCFEASISVVTTKIGGISSGAAHPDPASDVRTFCLYDHGHERGSSPVVCFTLSRAGELSIPWTFQAMGDMSEQLEKFVRGIGGRGERGGKKKEVRKNRNARWVWLIYAVGERHAVLTERRGGSRV